MVQISPFHRFGVLLASLLATLLLTAAASAQPANPVSIRVVPQKDAAHPGDQLAIAVILDHAEGFHTWPSAEVKLPDAISEFAIRTEIGLADKPAWIEKVIGIQWPEAKPGKVADPSGEKPTVELPLYSHKAVAFILVKLAADAKPGDQTANIRVAWQSCNDQMCTPPEDKSLPVTLKVVAAGAPDGKPQEVGLFAAFSADKAKGAAPKAAEEPAADDVKDVAVRALAQQSEIRAGDSFVVAVIIDHAPEYHSWPTAGVPLPQSVDEFAIRTAIKAAKADWIASIDGIQWPEAKPAKVADPSGEKPTIEIPAYSGRAIVYLKVTSKKDAAPGPHELKVTTSYQACNATTCLPPRDTELPVKVGIVTGAPASPASNDSALFAGYRPDKVVPIPEEKKPAASTSPAAAPSGPTSDRTSLAGVTLPDPRGPIGLVVLFLMSCLGGAVLNLTPCVLPIIPIKVHTLAQHGGTRGRAVILSLWMALGVVGFWTALGVPMAFISRQIDASQLIFGHWWLTISIGLVIAALGVGIMGLFELALPSAVSSVETDAGSARGSFMFGVMAAVLGLPCFGFMAGGLLAGAATLPTIAIMAVFVGLGVGMAAPYVVLSAKPQLLKFLPRTGPASTLVKQVMGLLLLAAAAFYIASGIQTLVAVKPYMADSLIWWVVAFFILLACAWLMVRTLQITRKPVMRLAMLTISMMLVGASGIFAFVSTRGDHESWTARQAALAKAPADGQSGGIVLGVWVPYSATAFDAAIAAKKVVVVDFTATWCITCKALKRGILERDPVKSRLSNPGAVLLEADCSAPSTPGAQFLAKLGRTGVPTLAVWGPGISEPLIYNAYTPETVVAAVDKAEGKAVAANTPPVPLAPGR